jgi:hypothetical protein
MRRAPGTAAAVPGKRIGGQATRPVGGPQRAGRPADAICPPRPSGTMSGRTQARQTESAGAARV